MIDTGPGREHMRQNLMEPFSERWTGEEGTLKKGRFWPGQAIGNRHATARYVTTADLGWSCPTQRVSTRE